MGNPSIGDTFSSFSNRNGGGIIIFGVDESKQYEITGVYDVDKLQKYLVNQSKAMEPEVRLEIKAEELQGKYVVVAIVSECPRENKPCYIREKGMIQGSYIRVGDSD